MVMHPVASHQMQQPKVNQLTNEAMPFPWLSESKARDLMSANYDACKQP